MFSSYYTVFIMILFFGLILPQYYRHKRRIRLRNIKKRRGELNIMTSKLLSECVGKQVELYGEGGLSGFAGTVLEVENNLIKIEDKKTVRIINADMIAQIKIKKEK